jgi:hypothetical protein
MQRHARERLGRPTRDFSRRKARPSGPELVAPILIRRSGVGDQGALERLAALDCRTSPAGSFLLAEVNGELVAAAPIDVVLGQQADQVRRRRDTRSAQPNQGAARSS